MVLRARIILMAAEGGKTKDIAQALTLLNATVSKWRTRFTQRRIEGLRDEAQSGKPPTYDSETEKRVLALLDELPPRGYATWNGRLVSGALGDVSDDQVWRILRRHGICLARRKSGGISKDPNFSAKAADVVAL
ncbi:helix-turn-helix domain-containing protein [Syntrophobacter fumaroxidans]|uniref:Putative transposase n=1 Tax=Syntrophobacter fumaroxidans (strain DSM 10017 / MPOB) TaxID=335543 RepID=A0LGD4_SYNFM|nr:helix-turn-helix domain-containing protein [Syntrophobacter fumaroxidans]ABK16486.1 putative transposase [Syntrophobacter fumaroxidans MPOB]